MSGTCADEIRRIKIGVNLIDFRKSVEISTPFRLDVEPHHDNIIYLPREPKRCYASRRIGKGVGAMVTYSDLFTFVIMLCAVITLVVTLIRHKK